jgi:hypothetical protein
MPLIFGNPAVEAIFELVRAHESPSCTSRFQSLFGCETLDHLEKFAAKYRARGTVYQINANKYKLVDMALLTAGDTVCQAFDNARRYWSGGASGDPIWECLIELPVTVGQKVGQI